MGANPKEENRERQRRRTRFGGRSGGTEDQDFEEHKTEIAEPKEDAGELINHLSILLCLISQFLK